MIEDFSKPAKAPSRRCLSHFIQCKRKDRFGKLLKKAQNLVTRQLDLVKFLKKQRILIAGALTTLSPSQRFMLDKIATKTVKDYELNATASSTSSDPDEVAMILNSREDQIRRHFGKIRKRQH